MGNKTKPLRMESLALMLLLPVFASAAPVEYKIVFTQTFFHGNFGTRNIESDVRHVQGVVREELLDHVALVAKADDEIVDAVGAVHFHDVPQDRATADFDQRFGAEACLFAQARAEAAGEDDGFHKCNAPLDGE